jgi:hypothetical protein
MGTNMHARSSIVDTPETETPPAIVADGVTDDTDAMNWYFDRGLSLPVLREGASYGFRLAHLRLPPGTGYAGSVTR